MSGLSRSIGFFLVSFVPIAQDQMVDKDPTQAFVGAIAMAGVCTVAFGLGAFASTLVTGRPGRNGVVELLVGGLAAMATWTLLFRVWLSMSDELARTLGPLSVVSHLAVIFAVGVVTVLVTSRRYREV